MNLDRDATPKELFFIWAVAFVIIFSIGSFCTWNLQEKMLTASQYEQQHKSCQDKGYKTLARTNSRDEVIAVSCVKNIGGDFYPQYVGEKP